MQAGSVLQNLVVFSPEKGLCPSVNEKSTSCSSPEGAKVPDVQACGTPKDTHGAVRGHPGSSRGKLVRRHDLEQRGARSEPPTLRVALGVGRNLSEAQLPRAEGTPVSLGWCDDSWDRYS